MLLLAGSLFFNKVTAQVKFLDSTVVTKDAFYFWKADDPKPYHYGASINPHGNCVKVSNGFVFYTWYRGGWADRTLMVSRKKIGEGSWVHVALPAKLSLVGGKGDTHLTTNIGICPIDGTIHLMFDHHNEELNYIQSKKNIAFGPDSEFKAANFLPQQNYLIPGKIVDGVTYPDLFNNEQGEMYFERRLGSAVGGSIVMTYYNGVTWSPETTIIQGAGSQVSQGERNFAYGNAYLINGKFYYTYSVRWAESPTEANEGVYLMELGSRMNDKATTVDGKSYKLPIIDHKPFLIADPRSVPDEYGWGGGPEVAISPKNDIYFYVKPRGTNGINYLKKADETTFTQFSNKGTLGSFYGNRMYKFVESGEDLVISSCLAGTYVWREDFRMNVGARFRKSIKIMDNGTIVAVYSGRENSEKVSIYCYVFQITKSEYTSQTINFDALAEKTEGDSDFVLNATATSGLPVKFTSSNTNIAQIIEGNKVKIVGVGTCDIIAQQAGDGAYDAAVEAKQTLKVNPNTSKQNQTINFTLAKSTHTWGDADQNLTALASSGLTVTYESTDTDVAIIVDGKLQVKRAGKTTINAIQLGDATYNAAPIVSRDLVVPIRQQTISFEAIPEVTSGDPVFQLKATSNNPNAKLRYVLPNNQVAIVWSDYVMQVLGPGTGTVTVSEEGDDYFTAAQATKTITVKPKTHVLPADIEAEYFTTKSGVDVTRWSNSVFYLNSWGVNDFAEYTIDVPENGVYPIEIFAASTTTGKKLKIMKGSTELNSITLVKTPSLTRFLSTKSTITLQKGVQKIKVVGEVGGFNLDRFVIGDVTIGGGEQGSDDIFWIRNVATGKFLGEGGGTALPVVMHNTAGDDTRRWEIKEVTGTDFVNIDNMQSGIIRATGPTFEAGAFAVVTTTKAAPAPDADKVWISHYDEDDNTYRFEAGTSDRFLYYSEEGTVITSSVPETDERSKWELLPTSKPLSISNEKLIEASIKIFPNPAENEFTIQFQNIDNVKNLEIYNVLGKRVYQNTSINSVLKIDSARFAKGVYLVKAFSKDNKVFHSKLIVK